jgi:hypothetical protein
VKEFIFKKLHGNRMVWNLKIHILIIDVSQLTDAKKWLLILVRLLIFTKIDVILTYNFIYMSALCIMASMTRAYDYEVNMDMLFMPFSDHV